MTDEKTTPAALPYWANARMRQRAVRARLIAEREAIIEKAEADAKALDANPDAKPEAKAAAHKLVEVHRASLAAIDKAMPDTPEPDDDAPTGAEPRPSSARREAREARRAERRDRRGSREGTRRAAADADASENEPNSGTEAVRTVRVPSVVRLRQLEREVKRRKSTAERYPKIERHKEALAAAEEVLAQERGRHAAETAAPSPNLEAPPRAPEPVTDPNAPPATPGASTPPAGGQPSDTTITPGRPPAGEGGQ